MPSLHLPIHDPCHENWDAMTEDGESRRFCDSCSKHVHDLSAMTEREARTVLAEQGVQGRVCVRYRPDAAGRVQFKPELVHADEAPSRWRTALAAAGLALAAMTMVSGCSDGQPEHVFVDACVYEVGPWSFKVARGEGTCPAIEAAPEPEPLVMGEIAAVVEPPPEPVEPPEIEVMGEAPAIEPPPAPKTRMGKVALPHTPPVPPEPPELMGDIAVPSDLVGAPDEPCDPAPDSAPDPAPDPDRSGPRRL